MVKPELNLNLLYRQILGLRWLALPVFLALAALHQLAWLTLAPWLPPAYRPWLAVALYGLSGSLAAWLALGWLARNAARQAQTQAELRAAYDHLAEIHRQLLAVHDIGRDIASAADLQQVLELAARAPGRLAGALGAAVITFDEARNRLKLDMAWGLSDNHLRHLRQRVEAGIPAGRCQGCHPLTARVDSNCPLFEGVADIARSDGIRCLACLPLNRDQKREGIITAYFPSAGGPPAEQMQLLNIVATEIAAAIEGVRQRAQQMAAVYTVNSLAGQKPDLEALLEQVLETSLAGWGVQHGALLLYDEIEERWTHRAQRGLHDSAASFPVDLPLQLAEQTRQTGQPLLATDLAAGELKAAAAAPLICGGERIGALVLLATSPQAFLARHLPLLSAIAHQAALAVSHVRLQARLQNLAVVEERFRLSREIHDGLAQTLGVLGWQLDHLLRLLERGDLPALEQDLLATRHMVGEAHMDVREAIEGLRLAIDRAGGLNAALAEHVNNFRQRTGLLVQFEPNGEPALSPQAELQLLRIAQEGLTNVRKHAQARQVTIRLVNRPDSVELTITDDGRGFDANRPAGRQHVGLVSMRERAQSLGGDFCLATGPGQGTRLTVTLPLDGQVAGSKAELEAAPL